MKRRVLSGTRPTSPLHLGNLLGALENWKKFENDECYYMVADLHALTTEYETHADIKKNTLEVVLDYLASGLDPAKCSIFVQSHVHEHSEMSVLLSMITPLSWLERNPTYKDQIKELKGRELHTHGFLGYPVLQAADILLYKANVVPVGEDQLPHLELTREICRRFNHFYKKILIEPQAALSQTPKLPGLDGRKMSKSYNNCIYLSDSPEVVEKKVKSMFTDPARKRRTDKGHPEICPVFMYHKLFNSADVGKIKQACMNAEIGCTECKAFMAEKLTQFLRPIYEKREELKNNPKAVNDIVEEGNEKARKITGKTLREAKEVMGLWPV